MIRRSSRCGSSPRVWGTLGRRGGRTLRHRFIPTRVGNTSANRNRPGRGPVHPHACGEHSPDRRASEIRPGSSPRVWGTPIVQTHPAHRGRFIPTRVGNTFMPACGCSLRPVHPHACGEHYRLCKRRTTTHGSSPRVWGTRGKRDHEFAHARFIPTRVGNTYRDRIAAADRPVHPHACGEHASVIAKLVVESGSSPRVWGTPGWPGRRAPR